MDIIYGHGPSKKSVTCYSQRTLHKVRLYILAVNIAAEGEIHAACAHY